MNLVPLNIPPGIVRGATPYDTPGRWYDCNLIRWRQGVMEPLGGWVKQSATNLPFSGRIRRIHRWRDNDNLLRTLVLTDDEIRTYTSSGGYVDVSPSDLVSFSGAGSVPLGFSVGAYGAEAYGVARSTGSELLSVLIPAWSFSNYGEDVLMVSSADGRLMWYDVSNPTAACRVVGEYAISSISRASNVSTVTTDIDHNLTTGDLVKISGVTDATFDVTSIDVTVTGSDTFTYSNTGSDTTSSGGVVRSLIVPIGNRAVAVTEERHVVLIQAGGLPRSVAWCSREDFNDWDFTSTTNTAGLISLESRTPLQAIAKVRNGHLIFSETEVFSMKYVGQPFVHGFEELEETRLLGPRAFAHDSGVCFWWSRDGFYKSDGSVVQPIPCPVWDYLQSCLCPTNTASLMFASDHGSLPEIHWFFPSIGSPVADQYVIYNWMEDWWSIGKLTRAAMSPAIAGEKPLLADENNDLYVHDTGWLDGTNTRAGSVYIESSVVRVPPAGTQNIEIKQALIANGFDYDSLRLTVYGRQTPHGTERTFGPYTPRADGYIDTRITARDVRFRVEAVNDGDWNLGEIRADVAAGAKR